MNMKKQLSESNSNHFTRRSWLASTAAAGTAVLGGSMFLPKVRAAEANDSSERVLRLAHLTDLHVQPERNAEAGLIACFQHVQSLDDPPQLILTGGDSVMDVMYTDASRAKVQAEIWHRVIKNECSLPVKSAIGNHDVWGWGRERSQTTGDEPNWGKAWGEDLLGLSNRYYKFDHSGWRFIVLDSTYPEGEGYIAKLDDEQFEWLANTLAETSSETPVMVMSHIPILSIAAFAARRSPDKMEHPQVTRGGVHLDGGKIGDLFLKHPNVKLCVAGHLHRLDQVQYDGVTYCCNGAVSGNWWRGPHGECHEGYALVDLYADGSFENKYVTFGWEAAG